MFNKMIAEILPYMPKKLIWMFSKEYIAGETLKEAIVIAKKLNTEGISTTFDILGEFVETLEEAESNKIEYLQVIEEVEMADVDANYSLKPTFFGLLLDKNIAYQHIRAVVSMAASYKNFVRIDMEDSQCTEMTFEIYEQLKEEFPVSVGLVLQSCLKRTHMAIKNLRDMNIQGNFHNLRICKGIYVESENISYKKYGDINSHFLDDVEYMFQERMYAAIATHDQNVVENSFNLIEKYNVPKEKYEFQMLYGVTPALRKSILAKGHRMRVYLPFGNQWFGYSTRRLKENPKIAGVVIKALFKKG